MSGGELPIRPGPTSSIPLSTQRSERALKAPARMGSPRSCSTKRPVPCIALNASCVHGQAELRARIRPARRHGAPNLVGCTLPRIQVVCDAADSHGCPSIRRVRRALYLDRRPSGAPIPDTTLPTHWQQGFKDPVSAKRVTLLPSARSSTSRRWRGNARSSARFPVTGSQCGILEDAAR